MKINPYEIRKNIVLRIRDFRKVLIETLNNITGQNLMSYFYRKIQDPRDGDKGSNFRNFWMVKK